MLTRARSAGCSACGTAITLDPGFARAHAGLSFVHFQTALLRHTDNVPREAALARRFAERGLELDPTDPFVNFTMGRSFWLEGDLDSGRAWLERAASISPNYAQGSMPVPGPSRCQDETSKAAGISTAL
jgi:hypothetical protein